MRLAVPTLVGAAVVVGLIVWVAGEESPPSAAEALARAQRFTDRAEAVEYHGKQRFDFFDNEPGEADVEPTVFEEAAVFPDRARSLTVYDGSVFETLSVDDALYSREAESRDDLADEQWAESEEPGPVTSAALPVSPADLPDVISRARHPRLVRRSEGQTTMGVDVDQFEGDVFLVVTNAGRPTRLLVSYRDEYEADTTSIDFEHWNGDLSIEEPTDAEVDPTPFIDEEDVAAYADAALFQPRVIPEGWVLDSANVLADFSFKGDEEGGCDTVSLTFFDPEDEEGSGYLSLYLAPASCASERPGGADDFVAGPNAGWIEMEEGFATGAVTVGSTAIQFDSGLSDAELVTILADLVPLDLANPPAATLPLD